MEKQYSLQRRSTSKKTDATKQAEKLRKKGSLVRTVRIDNRYYLYTRKRVLKPHGDIDKDGVPNKKDCEPFNPKKHGVPTKEELYKLALQRKTEVAKQEMRRPIQPQPKRRPIQPTPKYGVQPTPTKEKLYRLALQKKSGIIGRPIQPTPKYEEPEVLPIPKKKGCYVNVMGYGKTYIPYANLTYGNRMADEIRFKEKHGHWRKYTKIQIKGGGKNDYYTYGEDWGKERIERIKQRAVRGGVRAL